MHWKALLTAIIIVAIAGLLMTMEIGKNYAEVLRSKVGNIVSLITKLWTPTGEGFTFVLTADMDSFQGQKYSITNSSISASGIYNYIKVGNQVVSMKDGRKAVLFVDNLRGTFEITSGGSVVVTGDTNYIEIGDMTISGQTRIEAEIVPDGFSLTDFAQDKITLSSVTGDIKRFYNGNTGQESLDRNRVEINGFAGDLILSAEGGMELSGSTVSIVTNKFTWV
jgi:hypothetical protein